MEDLGTDGKIILSLVCRIGWVMLIVVNMVEERNHR